MMKLRRYLTPWLLSCPGPCGRRWRHYRFCIVARRWAA